MKLDWHLLVDECVEALQTGLAERVSAVELSRESFSQIIRTVADDAVQFTAVPWVLRPGVCIHLPLHRSLRHRSILNRDPEERAQDDEHLHILGLDVWLIVLWPACLNYNCKYKFVNLLNPQVIQDGDFFSSVELCWNCSTCWAKKFKSIATCTLRKTNIQAKQDRPVALIGQWALMKWKDWNYFCLFCWVYSV